MSWEIEYNKEAARNFRLLIKIKYLKELKI